MQRICVPALVLHLALATGASGADAATQTVQRLVKELKSGTDAERNRAAEGLGKLGPKAAETIPALVETLADDNPAVRRTAAEALAEIGAGPRAIVPELRRIFLKNKDFPGGHVVAGYAAIALGKIAAEADALVPEMLAWMHKHRQEGDGSDSAPRLVTTAVVAFGKQALPALRKALRDDDLQGAALAGILALGAQAEPLLPDLITVMKQDVVVNWPGFPALGPVAVPPLIALMKDPNPAVADRAMSALGSYGHVALPDLVENLKHHDGAVRKRACEATWMQASQGGSPSEMTAHVVAALLPLTRDPDPTVRYHAVMGTCGFGGHSRQEVVLALRDPDVRIRSSLCQHFGGLRSEAGWILPPLTERLNDTNVAVRVDAVEALLRLGTPPDRVIPTLVTVLWSPGDVDRWRAIRLLATTGKAAADVERTLELVQWFDPDEDVRAAATQTLKAVRKRATQ